MRRLTEEAQQNMPKRVDNSITPVDDALQVAGAGLAAKMSPLDHGKIDRHTLNAMAVQQHMTQRQNALNNQQRMAQSHMTPTQVAQAHIAQQHMAQHLVDLVDLRRVVLE